VTPTTTPRKKNKRVSAIEWREAAIQQVMRHGVEGLSIEGLAKSLGVTKGGFYYHFSDRTALLKNILQHWEYVVMDEFYGQMLARHPSARERLVEILKFCSQGGGLQRGVPGGPLENALQNWAITEPMAMKVLRRVQHKRLEIIADMYLELGLSEESAQAHAFGLLAFITGQTQLIAVASKRDIRRRLEYAIALWIEAVEREVQPDI